MNIFLLFLKFWYFFCYAIELIIDIYSIKVTFESNQHMHPPPPRYLKFTQIVASIALISLMEER